METVRAVLLPLWPVLAGSLVLGVSFGVLGWRTSSAGFTGRLGLILAVLGLVGAAVLVVLGRVPGRGGLWLEIGLASVLAYVAGCVLGSAGRAVWSRIRNGARADTQAA